MVKISVFAQPYTITASAGLNGAIDPTGPVIVASGANQTFNFTPNSGYYVAAVIVDGASVGASASYTFTNVLANHTISVRFNATHIALNKPASSTYPEFDEALPALVVDEDMYSFWANYAPVPQWKVDLEAIYDLSSIVVRNYVEALPDTRYYKYTVEGSTDGVNYTNIITKDNTNPSVDDGDTYPLTGVKARYLRVTVTGKTPTVLSAHITDFRVYGTLATTYNITATAGVGGQISPTGVVSVLLNGDQTFDITPNDGYQIAAVTVDGSPVPGNPSSFTFTNVTAVHTISATFSIAPHLALNKPTTASSEENQTYASSKANDDDIATYWASSSEPGQNLPQWWKVDLGKDYNLTSIVIRPFVDGLRYYQYIIEASSNDITYTKIAEKTSTDLAVDAGDTYPLSSVVARYLKVTISVNSNPGATTAHITDFRVYGFSNLSVTGITANDKVYDGTTTAGINIAGATLVGVETGDIVSVSSVGATATFADKNVGNGKTVTVSGLTLVGADASKYILTQPTATAKITAKELTVGGTFVASNKTYDGLTAAVIGTNSLTLPAKVVSDVVTLDAVAVFANKTVGNAKVVSLTGSTISGADAANYTLSLTGAPTSTANITAKELTVGGTFTASNKTYDGLTAAVIGTNSLTLPAKVVSDVVTLDAVAVFANKTVGNAKVVSLTGSTISGADAANYTLSLTGAPTSTANITAKELTVGGTFTVNNKTFDNLTSAVIATSNLTFPAKVTDDVVSLSAVAVFADKNAATGKTVSLTGSTITGADAANYTLSLTGAPTTTADILAKEITVTPDAAQSKKVGDADPVFTYTFAPVLLGTDVLTGALGRLAGETAGTYAYTMGTLTGGTNYSLVFVASPATFLIETATGLGEVTGRNGLRFKNYPNPFGGNTTMMYSVPTSGYVKITLRNVTGQVIKVIVDEMQNEGEYSLNADLSDMQSGIYFATISLNKNGKETVKTIRMIKGK
jgi:hypothetical protein